VARSRGGRKARRTGTQRLLLCLNIAIVIACLTAAAGLSYVRTEFSNVKVVSLGVSLAPRLNADHPRNILIIGTDSADRLPANDPIRKQRPQGELLADVIMVLRLDPKQNKASLLSIPRDTYVPIADSERPSKINSAIYGVNGADRLIQTIKQNFGISIDNYVQIDFEGFRDLVSVLDGVPMYIKVPIRDRNTGLLLKSTGCTILDPVQALAYARSRHLEYQDPKTKKWQTDPTSDLGRISRQQAFIQRAAHRAIDKGARNPATALQLIDAATHVITMDDSMKLGDIKDVIDRFRNFDVDSMQKYQLPTVSGGDASFSYLDVNWDEADPVLDIFRGIVPGQAPDPSEVQVAVTAAKGAPAGDATEITNKLTNAQFDADVSTTTTTRQRTNSTTITYGRRGRDAALLLARYLDGPVTYAQDSSLPGARLKLSVGTNLDGIRSQPVDASQVNQPPGVTTTTTPSAKQGGHGSTTTSVPGESTTTQAPSTTEAVPTTTVFGPSIVDDQAAESCG
jgi:LCP family protein required for cell wall assembly